MKSIWIVDDDRSIRWVLEKALKRENLPCRSFENAESVLEALRDDKPKVLITDIRMQDVSGTELVREVRKCCPDLHCVVMTAFSDLESAVSSFEVGADEYLTKPFDINKAVSLLKRYFEESLQENTQEEERIDRKQTVAQEIVGQSKAMQEVFRAIGRLAQSHVTVLLTGESGTGKEVVARALHNHSLRRRSPFVAINTAAIPRELLESELFGHEKGAFTGATSLEIGRFEQARGGTLFLDEIGDMPMELQTRLLRVLSDGSFYRVGGKTLIQSDVRIIAATNQNLEECVKKGTFREDLYHRLNVIRLRLPPLRERREDISALTEYFMSRAAQTLKTERKYISPAAQSVMNGFDYPGNVRQLENICNWLTVMAPSQTVEVEDLPEDYRDGDQRKLSADANWTEALKSAVQRALGENKGHVHDDVIHAVERVLYTEALDYCHGRKIQASEMLGVGRNTLTRKLKELGIFDD